MGEIIGPGLYAIRSVQLGTYLLLQPDGSLQFNAHDIENPNTIFQVEQANVNNDLVNIKSNNGKYWRTVDPTTCRIGSMAVDPHELDSRCLCTLFKIMQYGNQYRILQKHRDNFIEPISEDNFNAYALHATLTDNQLVVFIPR